MKKNRRSVYWLKRWTELQLKLKTAKEFPAQSKFIDKFIYVILAYIVCLFFLLPIDGLKLSLYSAMSGFLSPTNYVETQLEYADYLRSTNQYTLARSLYSTVIEKLKSTNGNNQLLALAELKLAIAKSILTRGASKSEQVAIVDQALTGLGDPNPDTPKTLVETLRSLSEEYRNNNQPYRAYALLQAASRFWKTGPTSQSEGNTYSDLGETFEAKGDWQYVYKCYAHAYSVTKSCGDHDFNVYRLGKMALAKNMLDEQKKQPHYLNKR